MTPGPYDDWSSKALLGERRRALQALQTAHEELERLTRQQADEDELQGQQAACSTLLVRVSGINTVLAKRGEPIPDA